MHLMMKFCMQNSQSNKEAALERLSEAVEHALEQSEGLLKLENGAGEERLISAKFMCPYDGFSFPEVEPRLFHSTLPMAHVLHVMGLVRNTSLDLSHVRCVMAQGFARKHCMCIWEREDIERSRRVIIKPELSEKQDSILLKQQNLRSLMRMNFSQHLKLSKQDQEVSKVVIKEILHDLSLCSMWVSNISRLIAVQIRFLEGKRSVFVSHLNWLRTCGSALCA